MMSTSKASTFQKLRGDFMDKKQKYSEILINIRKLEKDSVTLTDLVSNARAVHGEANIVALAAFDERPVDKNKILAKGGDLSAAKEALDEAEKIWEENKKVVDNFKSKCNLVLQEFAQAVVCFRVEDDKLNRKKIVLVHSEGQDFTLLNRFDCNNEDLSYGRTLEARIKHVNEVNATVSVDTSGAVLRLFQKEKRLKGDKVNLSGDIYKCDPENCRIISLLESPRFIPLGLKDDSHQVLVVDPACPNHFLAARRVYENSVAPVASSAIAAYTFGVAAVAPPVALLIPSIADANVRLVEDGVVEYINDVHPGQEIVIQCPYHHPELIKMCLLLNFWDELKSWERLIKETSRESLTSADLEKVNNQLLNSGENFSGLFQTIKVKVNGAKTLNNIKLSSDSLLWAMMVIVADKWSESLPELDKDPAYNENVSVAASHFFVPNIREKYSYARHFAGQLPVEYNFCSHVLEQVQFRGCLLESVHLVERMSSLPVTRLRRLTDNAPLGSFDSERVLSRLSEEALSELTKENAIGNTDTQCVFVHDKKRCTNRGSVFCGSCLSFGLVKVNMFYCEHHMSLHGVKFNDYHSLKKHPGAAGKQTVHDEQLLYSSWRHLFENSPHLCLAAGVSTLQYPSVYSLNDAVLFLKYSSVTDMGEKIAVSYEFLLDDLKTRGEYSVASLGRVLHRCIQEGEEAKKNGERPLDTDDF